jgi:hypothetical protein
MCGPAIALIEIATSGALSSAIGGVLGSQILGGAVVGLMASGGNPIGAITGGLAAGIGAGGFGGGIDDAASAGDYVNSMDAASDAMTTGVTKMAQDTVGNEAVTGLADSVKNPGLVDSAGDGAEKLADGSGYDGPKGADNSGASPVADSGTPRGDWGPDGPMALASPRARAARSCSRSRTSPRAVRSSPRPAWA